MIGVILLSFGGGSIIGSIVGGRYSDRMLQRYKKANGGAMNPEMRLKSTIPAMPIIVAAFLAYGWTIGQKVHIAGPIICLIAAGFSLMSVFAVSPEPLGVEADGQDDLLEHACLSCRFEPGE
jgi:predicted MFS family arabinose efflux permease